MTQQDLAARLGVSRQTINAIENRRADPGLRLALRIAQAFAARVEDVFRLVPADAAPTRWSPPMPAAPRTLDAGPVRLRPHRHEDLPAFQRFVTDADATRHMAFTDAQKTEAGAAELMSFVIASYQTDQPVLSWTIADHDTDAYLGAAGGAEAGDGAMELFVTLLPEARGRGFAAAAVRALAQHFVRDRGAARLIADVVEANQPARTLFERLGFRCDGPVTRAREPGELEHRDMAGLRYSLHREQLDRAMAVAPTTPDSWAALADATPHVYVRQAERFIAERSRDLAERPWLDRLLELAPGRRMLDLGCGCGEPITARLLEQGCRVTGLDTSPPLIEHARARLPDGDWRVGDMRRLDLVQSFDAVVAWDSFFHLTANEQRDTLPRIARALRPGGVMLITVGPRAGQAVGAVGDERVYHASLDRDEYARILDALRFRIVDFIAHDPACTGHSVLLAAHQIEK